MSLVFLRGSDVVELIQDGKAERGVLVVFQKGCEHCSALLDMHGDVARRWLSAGLWIYAVDTIALDDLVHMLPTISRGVPQTFRVQGLTMSSLPLLGFPLDGTSDLLATYYMAAPLLRKAVTADQLLNAVRDSDPEMLDRGTLCDKEEEEEEVGAYTDDCPSMLRESAGLSAIVREYI